MGLIRYGKACLQFIAALFLNVLFHWEGTIPAWNLLVLHFVFGLSLKWFRIALGIWFVGILVWMRISGWFLDRVNRCGSHETPPQKNVNPYSVGNSKNPENLTKRSDNNRC